MTEPPPLAGLPCVPSDLDIRAGDVLWYEPAEYVVNSLRDRGLRLERSPHGPLHWVVRAESPWER